MRRSCCRRKRCWRRTSIRCRQTRANPTSARGVQARNGHVHIFMPPLKRLEEYVALLATVEGVAEALSCPVIIEGYTPPRDPRARVLAVTPDPGVIEVNVHPATNWNEVVDI